LDIKKKVDRLILNTKTNKL